MCQKHKYPAESWNVTVTFVGRHGNMIHVDENEHQIWREMGRAVMSNPSNKVDVSSRCPAVTEDIMHCGTVAVAMIKNSATCFAK